MTTQTSKKAPAVAPPPAKKEGVNSSTYENNPFLVPIDGIRSLLMFAKTTTIVIVVLMAFNFIVNTIIRAIEITALPMSNSDQSKAVYWSVDEAIAAFRSVPPDVMSVLAIIAIFALIAIGLAILIAVYFQSVFDLAAANSASGKTVGFRKTLAGAWERFGGYLWMQVIIAVKIFLWSLLLIVPGIIMAVRYSLAGLSYFDKKLSANDAVKDSIALTQNGWVTTFASGYLLNLVTLGIGQPLVTQGAKVRLYSQFNYLAKHNKEKPEPHILSWLSLVAVLAIAFFMMLIVLLGVMAFMHFDNI